MAVTLLALPRPAYAATNLLLSGTFNPTIAQGTGSSRTYTFETDGSGSLAQTSADDGVTKVTDPSRLSDGRAWGYAQSNWTGITLPAGCYVLQVTTTTAIPSNIGGSVGTDPRAAVTDGTSGSTKTWLCVTDRYYSPGTYQVAFRLDKETTVGVMAKCYNAKAQVALYENAGTVEYVPNGGTLSTPRDTQWTMSGDRLLYKGSSNHRLNYYASGRYDNNFQIRYEAVAGTKYDLQNPSTRGALYLVRTGYHVDGPRAWSTSANGTGALYSQDKMYDGLEVIPELATTPFPHRLLYANWLPNSYAVAYDPNGGTGTTPATQGATYDQDVTLATAGLARAGYLLTGWNTSADGSGTHYGLGATTRNLTATNGGTVTLYAQWTPDPAYRSVTVPDQVTVLVLPDGTLKTDGELLDVTNGSPYAVTLQGTLSQDSASGVTVTVDGLPSDETVTSGECIASGIVTPTLASKPVATADTQAAHIDWEWAPTA